MSYPEKGIVNNENEVKNNSAPENICELHFFLYSQMKM